MRRLSSWRGDASMLKVGRESVQAGRTTKVRFECGVAGRRQPWHAVGYLLEDAEPPIYIEFRTRHQGTSPEVEARWLALADTLQWSPLSG